MNDQVKKGGCGNCLGKGCLVLAVIVMAVVALVFFGYQKFTDQARKFTAEHAKPLPIEKTTREEYEALLKRMDAYKNAAPGSNARLTLSAHDLNTLIAFAPDWSNVRGKIQVRFDGDKAGVLGSIPLAAIPELRDRYLNGAFYFTMSMDDKVLHITIPEDKLSALGLSKEREKSLSNYLESQMDNRLLGDPVLGPVLIRTETLRVMDGSMLLISGN